MLYFSNIIHKIEPFHCFTKKVKQFETPETVTIVKLFNQKSLKAPLKLLPSASFSFWRRWPKAGWGGEGWGEATDKVVSVHCSVRFRKFIYTGLTAYSLMNFIAPAAKLTPVFIPILPW